MKILIITYFYAPDLNPRAFRWSAIAARLAQAGHRVDVLCASPGEDANAEASPTVHRVRDWLVNASQRYAPERKAGAQPAPGALRLLRAALRSLARFLWRGARWPDYACGWLLPGARKARALCRETRYDWIISVSHPYTGHVVGLLARKAAGARWLVDIGDPFHLMEEPAPNNRRLFQALNRRSEGRVLARADAICVTTEETKRLYLAHFPVAADKFSVIGPLLSLSDPVAPPAGADGALKLVYCGTLYGKLRSPRRLLDLFGALARAARRPLELHFYGLLHDCADMLAPYLENPASGVRAHGLVGRAELAAALAGADVLVNIGNDSAAQLPSKVIEYMATGKPILNLPTLASDASTAELAGYPPSLTIAPDDAPASPEVLARVLAFLEKTGPVDPALVSEVRRKYSADHVTARYLSLLRGERP